MNDNYTPSTEQVRSHYVFDQSDRWDASRGESFDSWLAAHDSQVLMDARHLAIGTPAFDLLTARAVAIAAYEARTL